VLFIERHGTFEIAYMNGHVVDACEHLLPRWLSFENNPRNSGFARSRKRRYGRWQRASVTVISETGRVKKSRIPLSREEG
jgi:hypothetical protein